MSSLEREETLDGPFDGPRRLVHVEGETRWTVTPARAAAELEAHARLAAHPLAVASLERRGDALVFPRLAAADPAEAVDILPLGEAIVLETTPRRFLDALGGPVDAVRALGRIELARSRIDRFLDRRLTLRTTRGVDLGGVMPASIRSRATGLAALSVRLGRVEGWPVLDLASLALRAGLDTAPAHASAGGDDDAFELALLHQALRELSAERDEGRRARLRELARASIERFVPREPARVQLRVAAPAFLPPAVFAPLGEVDSAHARRILGAWDGLAVGGDVVRVVTEPPLARPARCFAFEPRRARRARLFSRFEEGIAFDDEGLFSATPEALALRIAAGLEGVVVDATCGIGSIAIAMARSPRVSRVVAIDRDASRLAMAEHNARIYGVHDRIDFRAGDALALVPTLAFDALVVDPPWGGRGYDREHTGLGDLRMPIAPLLGLPGALVLKLPRSFDVHALPADFEIEALLDERGVLKMLVARRGVRSGSSR